MTSIRTWQKVEPNSPLYIEFTSWMREQGYSDYSIYRCVGYLQALLVQNIVKEITGQNAVVGIQDIKQVKLIRSRLRFQAKDGQLHHVYSASVGRYIKYLIQKANNNS